MSSVSTVLTVEGMSCNHCVNHVKNAVTELAGVKNVEVDLKAKKVTIEYTEGSVALETIRAAIADQGYEVQ